MVLLYNLVGECMLNVIRQIAHAALAGLNNGSETLTCAVFL